MSSKVNRELFQKLASDFEEERMQSTIEIIQSLNKIKGDDMDLFKSELEYGVQRLMKSLSTNKRFSRLGYSVCLGELLNLQLINIHKETNEDIETFANAFYTKLANELPLNDNENKKDQSKKIKGKEERGDAFGRLFGLQILSNPPLFETIFFEKHGKKINYKVSENYIKQLYQLSNYKSWIAETALFAILEFVMKILGNGNLSEKHVMKFKKFVIELLNELDLTMSLEGLAIYLKLVYGHGSVEDNIEALKDIKFSKLHWQDNDPLAKTNLNFLVKVLKGMEMTKQEGDTVLFENSNKGFWTPRLHFAYNIFIEQLNHIEENKNDSEKGTKKLKQNNGFIENSNKFCLKDFAVKVIDETFFAEKSSTERKYNGFEMIKILFETESPIIDYVFTLSNFKRVFINQISNKDRLLHKQAKSCMDIALKYYETHSENIASFLIEIWELEKDDSFLNFDNLTKTKFCQNILSLKTISNDSKMIISKTLVDICQKCSLIISDESLKKYKFCIDQLLNFLKNQKETIDSQDSENWAMYSINKLCDLSFFKTETELKLSDEDFDFDDEDENNVHVIATERLYSIIGELFSNNNSDILTTILQYVIKNESDANLLFKLDPELLNIKLESISTLVDLKELILEASEPKIYLLQSVQILIQTVLLQMFNGNPDALQLLDDLLIFYQSVIINEEEDKSLIGITEIYLVLLSQSKTFLRKIVTLSFNYLTTVLASKNSDFLKSSITPFLDVLKARENKTGFEHLFQGGEVEEIGEESKENDSDKSENESDIDMDDMSEIEFDGMSEDSDSEVNQIEKEATSALAKALKLPENMIDEKGNVKHDLSNDNEDSDELEEDEEEDEDEELLDDEQMMQLDSTLSNIFKHRKEALTSINTGNKRKVEVQNARETVITLKNRVVDLIETFIKSQENILNNKDSTMDQNILAIDSVLIFMIPLIECIRTTTNKALSDKIAKIMKTKLMKLKIQNYPESNEFVENIATSLQNLHKIILTEKPGLYSKLFYNIASTCSLFHCKLIWNCSSAKDNYNFDKINGFYTQIMNEWVLKSDIKLAQSFFTDFINWATTKRHPQKENN